MPSITVKALGLTDPPPLPHAPVFVHYNGDHLDCWVLNAGMASGEPSIMLSAQTPVGLVVIETSLFALLACARAAKAMAETQFGREMPA